MLICVIKCDWIVASLLEGVKLSMKTKTLVVDEMDKLNGKVLFNLVKYFYEKEIRNKGTNELQNSRVSNEFVCFEHDQKNHYLVVVTGKDLPITTMSVEKKFMFNDVSFYEIDAKSPSNQEFYDLSKTAKKDYSSEWRKYFSVYTTDNPVLNSFFTMELADHIDEISQECAENSK